MPEIKFDFSDFNKKFKDVTKKQIPVLLEKGIGRSMLQLLNDCVMEVPTVPLREGWLRGSGSIFVQNKLVSTSEDAPRARSGFVNKNHNEGVKKDFLVGVIGYNTPYAAKVHEGITMHFREPSSGAKYLESKMMRNRKVYMEIIANTIKEGGK